METETEIKAAVYDQLVIIEQHQHQVKLAQQEVQRLNNMIHEKRAQAEKALSVGT